MVKLVYVHNENDVEVLAEITTNRTISVEDALELSGVDMDVHAAANGWDDYDYNALGIRV